MIQEQHEQLQLLKKDQNSYNINFQTWYDRVPDDLLSSLASKFRELTKSTYLMSIQNHISCDYIFNINSIIQKKKKKSKHMTIRL